MKRVAFTLTPREKKQLKSLRPIQGHAYAFWEQVAVANGLDYRTILYIDGQYSALPLKHKKYWCWPYPLICRIKPEDVVI